MHSPSETAQFEQLVLHLQHTRGFDFSAYKRTSLMRRVLKRMQTVGISSFEEYLDFLQVHQGEFAALFNTILINVTSFYRDPEVWEYLRDEILPRALANGPDEPFRVWSAGCASGQEPYTAAMVLAELLGPEAFKTRVKIYATDVDEEALATARAGVYSERQLADVPPGLADKYFDPVPGGFSIKREVRRGVIFGRHDLLQDAPISRIDLLLCRNTLMYFNAQAQAGILAKFFFSLNLGGHLALGRAEMLLSHSEMFTPVDLKRRVFRTAARSTHRERFGLLPQIGRDGMTNASTQSRLREIAFESDLFPQIVVDVAGTVIAANLPARQQFGIGPADLGRPVQDLEVSYRPAELRAALNRAQSERRPVQIKQVAWVSGSVTRYFDVDVAPLTAEDATMLGTRVSFQDVTEMKALQAELQRSKVELETAYEELQSTNEELETTNEELQSTIEELETTNEELQSTNEELETMNEELQSTNEELQTMNDELRNRSTDLNSANSFLEAVFTSLRAAVVVVDRDFRIQVWNTGAFDLWGARPDEVQGTHFLSLDIGLPVAELRQPIRQVLSAAADIQEAVVAATSRRGKPIECRVSITPLRQPDRTIAGAILLIEEKGVAPERIG